MNNTQISQKIKRIAEMMTLTNASPYKINSYQKAARIVNSHPEEMGVLIDEDRLKDVPGIGDSIGRVILYLAKSGGSSVERELQQQLPEGLVDLLDLPGLGLIKVEELWRQHDIDNLDKLEQACRNGRLESLKGFGPKLQVKLLKAIEFQAENGKQYHLNIALKVANDWLVRLSQSPVVNRIEISGQLRRTNELILGVDLLIVADLPALIDSLGQEKSFTQEAEDHLSFEDECGLTIHLWCTDDDHFSEKQLILTGGPAYLVHLDGILEQQGMCIEDESIEGLITSAKTEVELCQQLGLQWIEPELRDQNHEFPTNRTLISPDDIKGIFHAHSTWSDGIHSLEEMVESARSMGYTYLGISEHSQAAYYANGLEPDRVRAQWELIDKMNDSLTDFKIFKGIEADILKDGNLDYDESLLEGFDFVIASIHSHFHLDPVKQTDRIIRALQSPFTTMLGHPTGRMLLAREGYAPDIPAVIQTAVAFDKIIEINTTPKRLDLDWRYLKMARELGVKISINPDAHRATSFDTIPLGVMMARKGGLSTTDVVNTMNTIEIETYLHNRRHA